MECNSFKNIIIRNGRPADYEKVISVMVDWWGGRDLRGSILKIFFMHFQNTIFIAEKDNELAGFLIGFLSQSNPDEAYIHFAGVHPDMRKIGLGRYLYEHFIDTCKNYERTVFRSCTSIVNRESIVFHQRIGFMLEPGDDEIDGIPITHNYLGKKNKMVLFRKSLK